MEQFVSASCPVALKGNQRNSFFGPRRSHDT
jgi:hypothetical protein